jgi:hypothetical protein
MYMYPEGHHFLESAHAGFLTGLHFNPKNGGDKFLSNVG